MTQQFDSALEIPYRDWTIYQSFGNLIAAYKGEQVLGFFTSVDDAKRAIDKLTSL